jgi:hypothetical protein
MACSARRGWSMGFTAPGSPVRRGGMQPGWSGRVSACTSADQGCDHLSQPGRPCASAGPTARRCATDPSSLLTSQRGNAGHASVRGDRHHAVGALTVVGLTCSWGRCRQPQDG